jgi:SAM-dependent methyltransferase
MKWKHKAAIQFLISCLPHTAGSAAYYALQRHFGRLRKSLPVSQLAAATTMVQHMAEHSTRGLADGTVVEIGTGRGIALPTMLWLSGAKRIITVDLHCYLKEEIVREDILYLQNHRQEIFAQFEPFCDASRFACRFNELISGDYTVHALLEMMNVCYLAPSDARDLDMPRNSVDFHVSSNVLEHIPAPSIVDILNEGRRVLKPDGLLLHDIDCSDHFAHEDMNICNVNFLRFSERQWHRYAGNQFMYQNRLRVDDFHDLFECNDLHILRDSVTVDMRALAELRSGFPLHERFRNKSPEVNASTKIEIVAAVAPRKRSH